MTSPTHACTPKTPAWQPNNTKNTGVINGRLEGLKDGPEGWCANTRNTPGPDRTHLVTADRSS